MVSCRVFGLPLPLLLLLPHRTRYQYAVQSCPPHRLPRALVLGQCGGALHEPWGAPVLLLEPRGVELCTGDPGQQAVGAWAQ